MIYIKRRYCFCLVCTSRKAINFFEVKVHVQKGAPEVHGNFGNKFVGFIQFTFSFISVIWS